MGDEGDSKHPGIDPALLPLVAAKNSADADLITARIIADAVPLVTRIIDGKLKRHSSDARDFQEADELNRDVIVRLLARLEQCRVDFAGGGIANWGGYVATTTRHACHEYIRWKYPQRHRLKNKLRYFFTHQPCLAMWQADQGNYRCGRDEWRTRDAPLESVRVLLADASVIDRAPHDRSTTAGLARLVDNVLNQIGGPLDLDDLVEIVARIWGVKDREAVPLENADESSFASDADASSEIESQLSSREELQLVWTEIVELPANQRAALLLNMRDDAIMLFPIIGVASIREIALSLGKVPRDFALLWERLPLEDAVIAVELGVTRQQVINLRKAARARLDRRLKTRTGNIALV